MHMNYSQFMSLPVPICLEKWGVMTPSSYGSATPGVLRASWINFVKINPLLLLE